ncbi:MAG: DUF433 domain-containing protein [Alphaproteobacteria bacterium]|jgi:uncharacterized protein (DUF433 family)
MAHDRIVRDPRIMSGQPVIAGTRIPVAAILNEFSVGETEVSILEAYPTLTREDIRAALAYASRWIRDERLIAAE